MESSESYFSTVINPIRFFQVFFSSDKFISEQREFFFPDPNDPDDPAISWTNNIITNIDKVAESYGIEFEEDVEWEIDETVIDVPVRTVVKSEWRSKTIFFKDQLSIYLSEEIQNSKKLTEENIAQSANQEANKSNIAFWLDILQDILPIANDQPYFSKYPECVEAIQELINFMGDKSRHLFPDNQSNESEKSIPNIFSRETTLAPKFYSEILQVVDEQGNKLFADMDKAKENLLFIAGGNLTELSPVDFQWPQEAVYYLLSKIKRYNKPSFKIDSLVSSPNVKFRGNSVNESSFSSGFNKYQKKKRDLKRAIDNLIDRFCQHDT